MMERDPSTRRFASRSGRQVVFDFRKQRWYFEGNRVLVFGMKEQLLDCKQKEEPLLIFQEAELLFIETDLLGRMAVTEDRGINVRFLREAMINYHEAVGKLKSITRECPRKIYYAAQMALGIAYIGQMAIKVRLEENGEEKVDNKELREEFFMAFCYLTSAWYSDCKDWERFDQGMNKMIEIISKREAGKSGLSILGRKIEKRRTALLCEISRRGGEEGELATKMLEKSGLLTRLNPTCEDQ